MTASELTDKNLREIYDAIDNPEITYESWLRKLHRFAEGNVRTTRRVQRTLGVEQTVTRKQVYLQNFIAYDGEGYGNKFVLLANSLGERIVDPDGLSTEKCLEFLTRKYEGVSKRVWFSFSYDVNHILRDIPDTDLLDMLSGKAINYKGYTINYIPGKIFSVNNYRHYDVFSFFATNFINVVATMLGRDRVTEKLIEGKLARGSFEQWNIDDLIAYNDEELELLVEIMNKLRDALIAVDVRLSEWYGPGAIAKYWFKKYQVKVPAIPASVPLYKALKSSYYGGRFEQLQLGRFRHVYEYDIRSAYPSVMSTMPAFSDWRRVKSYADNPYSIWYVTFDMRAYLQRGFRGSLPLPVRSRDGHICFPALGKGWYWQHELQLVRDFFPKAKLTIHEGYKAEANGTPFAWVKGLYEYRQKLKSEGNLAHYAIKVGLNSLYGKTAQTVGSNIYHSLAWAGYITSSTRVKIARAAYSTDPDNLIGFATDALFTTKAISDISVSDDLGDWEEQLFDVGTFFQSGVYRLERPCDNLDIKCPKCNGTGTETQDRYRGSPLRRGIDDIIRQLKGDKSKYPSVKISRFISHLLAIRDPKAYGPYRLEFITVKHTLQIDAPFKRHYNFITKLNPETFEITYDYGKLLREPIKSLPKVWVEDVYPFHFSDNLYRRFEDTDIESVPNKQKDSVLQQLIEDGNIAAQDSPYIDVESVEILPVVEDMNEG
jgi:hypothetical protein